MAKKEAYCTQCGSLIQVDDTKSQVKCIFCGSEIDTQQALKLNEDPESRELLQQQVLEQSQKIKEEKKKHKPDTANAKSESLAVSKKSSSSKTVRQMTVVKPLPLRVKLIILGIFVMTVIVISAILVPLISTRDAKRHALETRFDAGFSVKVVDFTFKYHNNREIWLVTSDEVDETLAREIFNEYYAIYEKEYPSLSEKTKAAMKVRIYAPAGLYLCYYQNGILLSNFSTADPTPTPGITTTIGN
jgi:predicted  nucleic acid-binding Zn-ribbon protein